MTEHEFILAIDCCFPYSDEKKAKHLIELGCSISPNAAFMVLHELCQIPRSVSTRRYKIQKLIEYWSQSFSHPLNPVVVPVASKLLHGKYIPVKRCIKYMELVAAYSDCINALNILYFSCDDTEGSMESAYDKIISKWQSA